MNNMTIIANACVAAGFLTEDEINNLISEGQDIPFHTSAVWKKYFNMIPCKGQHGYETRIWRKKNNRNDVNEKEISEEERNREFYLTKAYLFHISQCVPITQTS